MTRTYQWTIDNDKVVYDAIMVEIARRPGAYNLSGVSDIELLADVYWEKQTTPQGAFAAGQHMGWPVVEALQRAEELRAMMNVPRVVITMAERGIWRDEWGTLANEEGY